jgi:hypothetical protein
VKIVDDKYRNIIRYYAYMINNNYEDIKAFEENKIDNEELDDLYMNTIGLFSDCNNMLNKYGCGRDTNKEEE